MASAATGSANRVVLPELPFDFKALEPVIDEATMRVHYLGHHTAYTAKTNAVFEAMEAAGHSDVVARGLPTLLGDLKSVPDAFRAKLGNVGGGFQNHCFFWLGMSAPGKDARKPSGKLGAAIDKEFGSFDEFKTQFSQTAATVFGSGWAWLSLNKKTKKVEVAASFNQDTPANDPNNVPLICLDVWEHAYYLQYKNKRAVYIDNWWKVADWKNAEALYDANI
mmetsp:Transcript_89974/g.160149  ORF Transcript_89974/g.160149 Transcript_89974/m.160149 type:complete len:222 (-) Transcript_89974:195-860(-)|eukprot:CAMPEP_0197692314 /NCGR_PEP_ID=MMETSP1338-20131121/110905_1 /TAXON_ID=43686 ORGANISM="Pelagodinium beii, Strain RCC1491" /NCGR_SAMPLE_ID=MMETSP1338 /ASSEMBLY_ACC=CAM_ASM_000754 /LENGTH=221 /DNA_ID=CAMNT_0043274955 /DNA_START=57 /DNA_END=722 /DNA_ORIENTATION=+